MSGVTRSDLDLREQLAWIDRAITENQKLSAGTRKLPAKGRKPNRDPWFIILGAIIAALATRLPILRAFRMPQ